MTKKNKKCLKMCVEILDSFPVKKDEKFVIEIKNKIENKKPCVHDKYKTIENMWYHYCYGF